tara:strand:+ start:3309 stop:4310 length:1002 start_codon:yes stop_codon:yes gene_type:complete
LHSYHTTSKNKIINIGILGLASIAKRKLIPTILALPNKFKLIGVATRTREESDIFHKDLSCKIFNDYNALVNYKNINAVYIPLPNSLHYYWAKKCLNKGLHVLVEKPATCSFNETKELIDIASISGLSLVETFQFRFHKQFHLIQNLIKEKKIGNIRHITTSFGFPKINFPNNIRYQKGLGGGSLFDAGVYPLKISSLLLGNNLKVNSSKLIKSSDLGIDMWGSAILDEPSSGAISQISFGFDNYYKCCIDIWGTKGRINADRIFTAPSELETKIQLDLNGISNTINVGKDDHFKNLMNYFYSTISNNNLIEDELKLISTQAKLVSEIQEKAK